MKLNLNYVMPLIGASLTTQLSLAAEHDSRPNIVVILCDDVSSDMFGCYGNTATQTPNIDRLASQGVAFRTAWSSALSGPARAQLMTGKYATTTGFWSNGFALPMENGSQNLFSYHTAFSKHLHDSGYTTAVAGKWHVGGAQHQDDPKLGFDEWCMWEDDRVLEKLGLPAWNGGREERGSPARYWHPCIVQNGKLLKTSPSDFGPDIYTNFICKFIDNAAKHEKPFLAYYPMTLPHGPYVQTPLSTKRGDNLNNGEQCRFEEMINYVDILVGRILSQVEQSGVAENTIFFFLADNGTAVTAKSRGVERGCHVPFIVSGHGVTRRGLSSEICDGTDLLPTLFELAQCKGDLQSDGLSLVPFISGATNHHKDMIHACIGTTQLLRSRDCLLEVYNPILGLPKGRFYFCGENHDGKGYIRAEGNPKYKDTHIEMLQILRDKYVGLTLDNPYFNDKRGKAFLKTYLKPENIEKHIHNHKDYQFYDETLE